MVAAKMAGELLLMVFIGWLIGKLHMVNNDFSKQLSALVVNVCLPCLIVHSMCTTFSWQALQYCIQLLSLSTCSILACCLLGQILWYFYGKGSVGRVVRFGCVFSNFTFVGIPVVEALFGDSILFYYMVYMIPSRIGMFTLGRFIIAPPDQRSHRASRLARIKELFSPPMVAILLGVFLYLTGLRPPAMVYDVMVMLKGLCAPLGMLICGLSFSQFDLQQIVHLKYIPYALIRTIVIPALMLSVCLSLNVDKSICSVGLFNVMCPCASLIVPYTIQYDDSPEAQLAASSCVFMSTILCTVTIPIWSQIISML